MSESSLCRGIRPRNDFLGYDINQSDDDAPPRLEHWGMRYTPSFESLPDPLGPLVVAPDRVLSMGQIEQFDI